MTINKSYDFIKIFSPTGEALIGKGLVLAEGDDHKRQRKMMNQAFIHSNIKVILHFIILCSKLIFE